jgi:hypothetical protein
MLFLIAYEPDIVQEYAERDLTDPRFIAPIRVTSCIFYSESGVLKAAKKNHQKNNSSIHLIEQ